MIKKWILILSIVIAAGCKTVAPYPESALTEAQSHMNRGELYRAKKIISNVLEKYPNHIPAEELMAQVLEKEIARQHDIMEPVIGREAERDQAEDQASLWLDRAEALLTAEEYMMALDAAEKVFIYDPHSIKASELIDKISKKARELGRNEQELIREISRKEADERIPVFRVEALERIENQQWAAAEYSLRKILLLDPENKEAEELIAKIREKQRT